MNGGPHDQRRRPGRGLGREEARAIAVGERAEKAGCARGHEPPGPGLLWAAGARAGYPDGRLVYVKAGIGYGGTIRATTTWPWSGGTTGAETGRWRTGDPDRALGTQLRPLRRGSCLSPRSGRRFPAKFRGGRGRATG